MGLHTVESGENLSSIAKRFKVSSWQEIYNHPKNSDFRKKRPNPNLIHVGDKVFIPDSSTVPLVNKQDNIEIQINGKTYVGTKQEMEKVVDAVIINLQRYPLKLAKLKLDQARTQYSIYDELTKSDRVVTWILDAFNWKKDLTLSKIALLEAEDAFKKVEAAIKGRFIAKIESEIERLEKKANVAITSYRDAIVGLGGSAEVAVTTLEITKLTSFAVLGACATALTGGAATGVLASSAAKLGLPALIATLEASAEEGGKAIANDKKQTAATAIGNIFTTGASSVLVGKLFASPKAKEAIGKLAYKLTNAGGKFTAEKLKVVVKQKTMKDLLEQYLEGTGSSALQSAIKNGVQGKIHTMTMDDLANELAGNQKGVGAGMLSEGFVDWGVKAKYLVLKSK
jgi:hypothetical protein